jgi:hypothetical protein
MSFTQRPSSDQPSGSPNASPEAVINELKRQAERKASLKMFYSAVDVFRDYRGPFASETAAERERLALEYDARGREAERLRSERGSSPAAPVAQPPPSAPPRPAAPPKPPPAVSAPKPVVPKREPTPKVSQQVKVEGGKIMLPCRWCEETIAVDVSSAGKLVPCPKCDLLVSVPKI